VQRITSAHNPRLREAARLIASSRDRRKSGKCVLEGEHLIAVYTERIGAPDVVIVSEDALDRADTAALVSRLDAVAITVPVPLFARFASLPVGVGVVAVVSTPREQQAGRADFCLLLEDLQDPGNVGSILRSAAAAGVDRVVRIFDTRSWEVTRILTGQPEMILSLAFSNDWRMLVTGGFNQLGMTRPAHAVLWDVASGDVLRTVPAPHFVTAVAFSHDGALVASVGGDATVALSAARS